MPYVAVTLLQSAPEHPHTFSSSLQQRAIANFKASGIDVRLGVAVTRLSRDEIELRGGEKIPYGICVWSTGGCKKHCCLFRVWYAELS